MRNGQILCVLLVTLKYGFANFKERSIFNLEVYQLIQKKNSLAKQYPQPSNRAFDWPSVINEITLLINFFRIRNRVPRKSVLSATKMCKSVLITLIESEF
jgi:hypothetical protein